MGDRILADLVREGVDVDAVRRVPGCASPSAAILIADDGERLLCTYNDPRLGPDPSWLPLDRVASFDAVLTDVRWPEGAAAVLDAARRAGKLAVFDGDVGPVDALLDLARRATHVAFSELGLERGPPGPTSPAKVCAASPGETRAWSGSRSAPTGSCGATATVERRAPAPAVTRGRHARRRRRLARRVHAARWPSGMTVGAAARFANAAAAIKCTRFGGRGGAPRRDEVEALLAG